MGGRLLFYKVLCSAIENGCSRIVAKCPEELESNGFYKKLGFELTDIEDGRKRKLNVWTYRIQLPLLFYCGAAGQSKYDIAAQESGWRLGINSKYSISSKPTDMQMVDNDWKNYDHQAHFTACYENKPLIATARDIEHPEQLREILREAQGLSQFCGRVLLIPKCKIPLPTNYWFGFSVPTGHGATSVEPSWFAGRYVHLLGGSPNAQARYARTMNVVSLDGNYAMKVARNCKATWQGREVGGMSSCYEALRVSLTNQKAYWHKEWDWREEPLFKSIEEVV